MVARRCGNACGHIPEGFVMKRCRNVDRDPEGDVRSGESGCYGTRHPLAVLVRISEKGKED